MTECPGTPYAMRNHSMKSYQVKVSSENGEIGRSQFIMYVFNIGVAV